VQAFKREDLEIEARQVSRKELQRIIDISGTLLPNEEVVVSSEVEGPVEKVLVDLGGRVKRGQSTRSSSWKTGRSAKESSS
jgi:hypothetical protein